MARLLVFTLDPYANEMYVVEPVLVWVGHPLVFV